jgi:hypothetical protein
METILAAAETINLIFYYFTPRLKNGGYSLTLNLNLI